MSTPVIIYCLAVVMVCYVGVCLSAIGAPQEFEKRRAIKERAALDAAAAEARDEAKRALSRRLMNLRRRRAPHVTIEIHEGGEVL